MWIGNTVAARQSMKYDYKAHKQTNAPMTSKVFIVRKQKVILIIGIAQYSSVKHRTHLAGLGSLTLWDYFTSSNWVLFPFYSAWKLRCEKCAISNVAFLANRSHNYATNIFKTSEMWRSGSDEMIHRHCCGATVTRIAVWPTSICVARKIAHKSNYN